MTLFYSLYKVQCNNGKVKYTTLFILPFCGKQRNRMELTGKMLLFAFGRENLSFGNQN